MTEQIREQMLIGGGKTKSPQRQTYLDYLKSLAITLVIVYHCQVFNGNCFISSILAMCVTIFFCVNGYLMLKKHRDSIYLLKKNAKMLFLIIFWGIIGCCIGTWSRENSVFIPETFIHHLYNLDVGFGNYLWFLITLVILNFLNPLIFFFINHSTRSEKIIFISFIGICTTNVLQIFSWQFNPFRGWHSFALLYYIMGYFLLATNKDKNIYAKTYGFFFLVFIILQTFLNYGMLQSDKLIKLFNGGDLVFQQYSSIFVICSTFLLILLFKKMELPKNQVITFVGSNTLGIYLIQDFVTKYLKYGLQINEYPLLYVVLSIMLSCLITFLFNKCKITYFLISM